MSDHVIIKLCSGKKLNLIDGERLLCLPLTGGSDPRTLEFPAVSAEAQDRYLSRTLDILAELADQNENQDWWYLPISEMQPNMSACLPALEAEAYIEALLKSGAKGRFVFVVKDARIAQYLLSLKDRMPGLNIVASLSDRWRWAFDRTKTPVRRMINTINWVREHLCKRSKDSLKKLPLTVHTLFVSRFEVDLENPTTDIYESAWSDSYLGELVEQGFQKTGNVVLFGRCGGDSEAIGATVRKYNRFNVTTTHQQLTVGNIFECIWRALGLRLRYRSDDPLAKMLVAESRNHVRAMADCILVELAMKTVLSQTKPKQIICMQENSVWEHAIVRAACEVSPDTRLIGYFHCPVMASAIRYHTRVDQRQRPMFDAIVPLGDTMAESLCKLGPWQSKLLPGYGFRNPDIRESIGLKSHNPQTPFRLVVLLGGMFDNSIFLKWVNEAREGLADTCLLIKGHPVYGSEGAMRGAKINITRSKDISDISSLDMVEALKLADCVIYKGTTAGLSAMAAGIPVIHVDHGGLQTDDTLFGARQYVDSVASKENFRKVVHEIQERTVTDRATWVNVAKKYAANYYDVSDTRREQVLDRLFSDVNSSTVQ